MKKVLNYTSLIVIFTLMCVFRLWYGILLFFSLGILLSLIFKNRIYCGYLCPMGALSDIFGSDNSKKLGIPGYLKYTLQIFFWSYIIYVVYMYFNSPSALWLRMFRFSVAIMSAGLILQVFFKNRTWCTTLCPVGKILSAVSKPDAKGPTVEMNKCVYCVECTSVCPLDREETVPLKHKVDTKKCLQCTRCKAACKYGAISFK